MKGQVNLVPNPSIELYDTCPYYGGWIGFATPWYNPTGGSPDYFNQCETTGYLSVPSNFVGFQYAKSGVAYAGICVYGSIPGAPSAREYLQIELLDTLIATKHYCVSFYVSNTPIATSPYNIAITKMGLLFSNNAIIASNANVLSYTPQITSPAGVFLTDSVGWTEISGTYIASGGEKYITIGNFSDNAHTDTVVLYTNSQSQNAAYYYIDDVSVTQCNVGISEINNPNSEILISPNPTTGIFTIHTEGAAIKEIKITNVLGETITNYELRITNETTVDLSNEAQGIYFVQITVDSAGSPTNKNVVNRKIIKY